MKNVVVYIYMWFSSAVKTIYIYVTHIQLIELQKKITN